MQPDTSKETGGFLSRRWFPGEASQQAQGISRTTLLPTVMIRRAPVDGETPDGDILNLHPVEPSRSVGSDRVGRSLGSPITCGKVVGFGPT